MRHEQRVESLEEIFDRVPGLGEHRLAATRLLTFALAERGNAVSKIGGAFLWPPNEAWPVSSGQPCVDAANRFEPFHREASSLLVRLSQASMKRVLFLSEIKVLFSH